MSFTRIIYFFQDRVYFVTWVITNLLYIIAFFHVVASINKSLFLYLSSIASVIRQDFRVCSLATIWWQPPNSKIINTASFRDFLFHFVVYVSVDNNLREKPT